MRHMLSENNERERLGIALARNVEIGGGFRHVWVSHDLIQHHTVSLKEVNFLFPLYLYSSAKDKTSQQAGMSDISPWPEGKEGRRPNLSPEFVTEAGRKTGLKFVSDGRGNLTATFGPEDLFDYIYATLHSPAYRKRYAEFLKTDFPRVPVTSDRNQFAALARLGGKLVAAHLLESPDTSGASVGYPANGTDEVETGHPKYLPPGSNDPATGQPLSKGRVHINRSADGASPSPQPSPAGRGVSDGPSPRPSLLRQAQDGAARGEGAKAGGQYFDGVEPEVWEFQVGGYQVCEKWLKDRRGRKLSYDDIQHYKKVVEALRETIRLMADVDRAIPKWPIQ
jgi:hypothetical protein